MIIASHLGAGVTGYMTTAGDVHLFAWMKENWEILATFLVVVWSMMVFWFRSIVAKFYTRQEINEQIDLKIESCKLAVDKVDSDILKEVGEVKTQLAKMDDRQREEAKDHTKKHEQIIRDMSKLGK